MPDVSGRRGSAASYCRCFPNDLPAIYADVVELPVRMPVPASPPRWGFQELDITPSVTFDRFCPNRCDQGSSVA